MEVSFIQRGDNEVDLAIAGGDLVMGDDLQTAVGLSLFVNRRDDNPLFDSEVLNSNQGWWGDVVRESPLGSLLWKYRRSKALSSVSELARAASVDALNWLVEEGVAESVDVEAFWEDKTGGTMILRITINKPSGDTDAFKYQFAWNSFEGE